MPPDSTSTPVETLEALRVSVPAATTFPPLRRPEALPERLTELLSTKVPVPLNVNMPPTRVVLLVVPSGK